MRILLRKFNFGLLFIAAAALLLGSCKISLIASYDQEIARQIDGVAKQVDKFYLGMIETSKNENNGRAYPLFAEKYVDIEVELNSLLTKNKIRPLNENSVKVCEIALQLWIKYKEEHKKDNQLSDGLIKLNRKYMSDLFYAMRVAEEGKKIGSETTK